MSGGRRVAVVAVVLAGLAACVRSVDLAPRDAQGPLDGPATDGAVGVPQDASDAVGSDAVGPDAIGPDAAPAPLPDAA